MDYGVSKKYLGESGESYFAWQNQEGEIRGILSAEKFAPYIRHGDRVLDFGCGGGHVLKGLPGITRVGVEANPAAHDECRANGVDVYSSLADVSGSFDAVITHHCLEHVPYPIEALRGLQALIKPGGRLIMVQPLDDWRVQRQWNPIDINNHLHTWTPLLLGNSLVEAGFRPSEIRVHTYAWPPKYPTLFRRLPRFAFNALCQFWSLLRKRRELIAVATPI